MTTPHSKVAVVTGAGSGIGRETAIALSERGYSVVLAGRRADALEETGSRLRTEWMAIAADVASDAGPRAIIHAAMGRFGRIDLLVNNAAVAPLAAIESTDAGMLRAAMETNALGPGVLISLAWPVFQRQRSGCIVNVSSMATVDPFPGFFAYAASKAAVELMVKSCAKEGKRFGIRAFAVAPGAVETPMLRANFPASALPPAKCLSPGAVAAVIVACAEGERANENGTTIVVPSPS